MQKSSNAYLLVFVSVLTVTCALLLAGVSMALKGPTEKNEALEQKRKILGAVIDINGMSNEKIEGLYNSKIVSLVIDRNGNPIDEDASEINIEQQYKSGKPSKLPIYKLISDVDSTKYESFILPMYGTGLWDNIWGFVSLGGDFNTIKGAVFDHKGETPGLGARIAEADVQERFVGKKLFNEEGVFKGVKMQKGEVGSEVYSSKDHQVDGMSGSTMTANGLNEMLIAYFTYYQPYFEKTKASNAGSNSGSKGAIDRNHKKL